MLSFEYNTNQLITCGVNNTVMRHAKCIVHICAWLIDSAETQSITCLNIVDDTF